MPFELNYARLFDPLLKNMRHAVCKLSGLKDGQSALDVCCGTGAQVFEFARHGFKAAGLDKNPDMLRQAAYYRAKYPDLKPVFIEGDATRLPFPDGAFDAASITLALHENDAPNQDAMVREMKRVVKPSGMLVFADFRSPMPPNVVGSFINLIELAAGADNRRTYREYQRAGGLASILGRHGLSVLRERGAAAAAVRLLAVPNASG